MKRIILWLTATLCPSCTTDLYPEPESPVLEGEQQSACLPTFDPSSEYDPAPGPSRWADLPGVDVEAGETNTQTAARAKQAAEMIKQGKVYQLGHVYEEAMPINPVATWDLTIDPYLLFFGQAFNGDRLTASIGQVGTQLDAFGHFGWNPPDNLMGVDGLQFYGQFTGAEVYAPDGLQHLGVEHLRTYFTRAILLDVARAINGGEVLDPGYEIRIDDIMETLEAQNLSPCDVKEGDVVLVRTGWETNWESGQAVYYQGGPGLPGGTPGIGLAVAHWFAERKVAAVGSDNWGVEVAGEGDREPTPPGISFPVHHHLLVKSGIPLQESMHLSELASDMAAEFEDTGRRKAWIVTYIMNPLPIRGGTGSPGVPIAIR